MLSSRTAYTRSGCRCALTYFGKNQLPRDMPPMKTPSRTPIDTAEDPSDNWSIWNQTTS